VLSSFVGLNSVDSLNMFASNDGQNWQLGTPSGAADYTPASGCGTNGCVRDPSIAKFGSTWDLVHTCIAALSATARFCITDSTDLVNWSAASFISTSGASMSLDAQAPEWVKNPDGTVYLDGSSCPHLIVTLSDQTSTWTLWEMHPTNNCSNPIIASWSTPVQLTITGEGQTLDPYMVCVGSSGGTCTGSGDTFYLWYVHLDVNTDEYIQYATSSTITGTYTKISAGGNWAGWGAPTQEGPCIIKVGSTWIMYFDRIQGTPGDLTTGQINYSESTNLTSWTPAVPIISAIQAKHGTVIPYP
jgi:hypothetical protein